MSLIHWWPLNGDTQDRITNTLLTNNGATIINNGKIGSCYTFNGSTNLTISYSSLNTLGNNPTQFSFAFWIKLNSTWTGWGQVFTIGREGGAWTDIRIGFDIASDKTGYFTISDGSTAISYSGPKHILTTGKWYHIAATFNNKEMKLFVDGQPALTPEATASVLPNLSSDTIIAVGGNSGEKGECDINDVRIYDHVLSVVEVKELSKALVVHYTFDDILVEPTTNYSKPSQWSIYSTYWTLISNTDSGFKIKKTSGNSETTVAFSNGSIYGAMAIGEIWTTTCYLYKNNQPYKSSINALTNYGLGISVLNFESRDDGYYSSTFKINSKSNAYLLHARIFGDTVSEADTYEIKFLQFEKKDHATPYTSDSRSSLLYNETGLVQPSTKNNIVLSTDGGIGTYSLNCQGSTEIITSNTCDISQGTTASVWIKGTIPTDSRLIFADSNSKTAFGFFNNGQAIITCAGYGHACVSNIKENWKTGWNNIVVTRDSSNNVSCYLNSNKLTLSSSQEWTHDIANTLSIGCRYSGGWTSYFTGLIDDFRFYATCLSIDDIKNLYQTKAMISDKGDIMCDGFVENKAEARVTEKSTFDCKETQEKLYIQGFELLDGILIEKNPYFNTGLVFSDVNKSIYVDAEVTPTNTGGNNCLAGCGNSDWNGPIMLNFCGGKMEFGTSGYSTSTEPQGAFAANERLTVQAEIYPLTQKWYKNNIQINNITQRTRTTTTATFAIGTFKTSSGTVGATHSFKGYIHRFYVKYGDEIRCYLPAKRKLDNVYGLYDIHTKTFLVNSGGGTVSGTASTLCDEAAIYQNGNISGREIIEI